MLELQRASAGSGKTYALARKFIWYFITIRESDEPGAARRLRTDAELADSLSHILAVTFTNKATAEMQQRIVDKLHALGYPRPGKTPDYMREFLEDLREHDPDVTAEQVSRTCRKAVGLLLNNYSDFHVSTIDSFFQQVLRTFAYETDLNDSYRIELDTNYLSTVAIDSLLEDLNAGREGKEVSYWVSDLMERASQAEKKWNAFAKNKTGDNPYSLLISSVRRLENEEFKKKRYELDKYFEEEPDLIGVYEELRDRYEPALTAAHSRMRRSARALRKAIDSAEGDIEAVDLKAFRSRADKAFRLKIWNDPKPEDIPAPIKLTKAYEGRKAKGNRDAYESLEALADQLVEAAEEWIALLSSPDILMWRAYRDNIPFLGLLQNIREKRERYLKENNAIEIGETNSMLYGIIKDDETPFIYERLGTRLNHFLIDEFQDTSDMQWTIMSPLLRESLGRGEENLIIGDAKQSIYRFRNADSRLISEVVPREFKLPDDKNEQNINWRSDLGVVQFNNSFFSFLSEALNSKTGFKSDGKRRDFEHDYTNVVQHPHRQEAQGYVEIHMEPAPRGRWTQQVLEQLPLLIENLLDRGFSLGNIAVLVDKHTQGDKVIEMFTLHNGRPERRHRIEFVSEQSLKLETSAAVSLVVSVLQTIARGADARIRTGEEGRTKGVADWNDISCNFRFFALRNPELTTPECLQAFFESGGDNDAIGAMLGRMQAVSLPALVEAISAELVPEDIRRREAVFMAAFQDIVIDYCNGHPSDVASFLKWWAERKAGASITSPEGMDAVKVMTVHKSKGLEFPVVILPFADVNFADSSLKTEWRWVRPGDIGTASGKLPPFLPVVTDKSLLGTPHEHLYYEFHDMKKMDALNSLYVAFTRAVNELYIFSEPKSGELYLSSIISEFIKKERETEGIESLDPNELREIREGVYAYGQSYERSPLDDEEEGKKEKEAREGSEIIEEKLITDYAGRITPDFLAYRTPEVPEVKEAGDSFVEEDEDPRSEGNLLHRIMEQVRVRDDIPRAVRRLVMNGLISRERGDELRAFLLENTGAQEVKEWFAEGWRVMNERPLLRSGAKMNRPDRVMVDEEGNAVVVDYKFGITGTDSKVYRNQVKSYVDSLKDTGLFRSVKGYLWFVKLQVVEFVAD